MLDVPKIHGFSFIADIVFPYPSRVCSSIFLYGCNFRCPFCINRGLVIGEEKETVDFIDLLSRLRLRGEKCVVISGGEPFSHKNLKKMLFMIRKAGMETAVATNGSFPDRMIECVRDGAVNHIMMDVKAKLDVESYSKAVGKCLSREEFEGIICSIDYLLEGSKKELLRGVSSEFRTTTCTKFVSKEDLVSIARRLGRNAIYVLQPYTTHQTLDPAIASSDYVMPYNELKEIVPVLEEHVFKCFVREV